jgi:tetratricopeptide (TPR) repeat protein
MGLAPKLRDAFERTVALDPAHVKARASLVEYYLMAPSMLGGGVDKARTQALEIGRRDKARGLLAQARIAGHEKQEAKVLQLHQAALAAAPGDVEIQYTVAMAHVQAEQWSVAVPLLRKVVAREPENAGAWYQIGRSAALSGKFLDEGATALQRYLAMPHRPGQPETKHALYRLGQIQARAGHPDQARATWQRALELDPKFAEVKAELARPPGS